MRYCAGGAFGFAGYGGMMMKIPEGVGKPFALHGFEKMLYDARQSPVSLVHKDKLYVAWGEVRTDFHSLILYLMIFRRKRGQRLFARQS